MRSLYFCLLYLMIFSICAEEPVTENDLIGTWEDDNVYNAQAEEKTFRIVFDTSRNGIIESKEELNCPSEQIKNIDNVLHISCLFDGKEVVRLVVAGWKSDDKTVLFGFRYFLKDAVKYNGEYAKDVPENYVFWGLPTSLVKVRNET